jgi:hypothetical protein
MGKKFKGKLCAYCSKSEARTGDHIFCRQFFQPEDRRNLPKAPACLTCNNQKSKLEHLLATILPFGARRSKAVTNLQDNVPRRLARNPKLKRTLLDSMRPVWMPEHSGLYRKTSMVEFDTSTLEGLLKFIGRGLAWHHWGVYLRPHDLVIVELVPDSASALFASVTSDWRNARSVNRDLGNGTVRYVGTQAEEPPELTAWAIRMYGGIVLSDDRHLANGAMESCSTWWIFTGPPEIEPIHAPVQTL